MHAAFYASDLLSIIVQDAENDRGHFEYNLVTLNKKYIFRAGAIV